MKNKVWFSGPDFLWKTSHERPLMPNNLGDISKDIEVKDDPFLTADLRANCVNTIYIC